MPALVLALFLLGAVPAALMALPTRRVRAEGYVGAHMVTGQLALLQALGLVLALVDGDFAHAGVGWPWVVALLPGYVLSMTALPLLGIGPGRPAHAAKVACLLVAAAGAPVALARTVPVAATVAGVAVLGSVAAGGYAALLGAWLSRQISRRWHAHRLRDQPDRFQVEQAAFQAGEYAKLPPQASFAQLAGFVRSFDQHARTESVARIAALPDLVADVDAALASGGPAADDALDYLWVAHHGPLAPFAASVRGVLERDLEMWQTQLDRGDPGAWIGNLVKPLEVAVKVLAESDEVRAPLEDWRAMLARHRALANLTRQLDKALRPGVAR